MITEKMQIEEMRLEILNNVEDTSKDTIFKLRLKQAKYKYLRLVYPFNQEIDELPNDRAKDWQTRCAIELYRLDGEENIKSYMENGLSESYEKAGLSKGLLNDLPPAKAGVPK